MPITPIHPTRAIQPQQTAIFHEPEQIVTRHPARFVMEVNGRVFDSVRYDLSEKDHKTYQQQLVRQMKRKHEKLLSYADEVVFYVKIVSDLKGERGMKMV
jgi:hypothetical protein